MDKEQLFYLQTRGLNERQINLPEELHAYISTYQQEAFYHEN